MKGKTLVFIIAALVIISAGAALAAFYVRPVNQKPVLRIGYLPITHAALPLIVQAQTQGELDTFRLEMVRFSAWPEMAEAIQAGKIDGGGSILNSLAIKIVANGTPMQSVLMSVRDGSVLITRMDIKEANDLKGKTIAIPSRFSAHYLTLYKYLAEHGLAPEKDVNMPEMAPPDMVQALASGNIDGYIVAEPFGALAEEMKVGRVFFLSKDIETPGLRSDECIIGIRTEYINQHPEVVQEFVDKIIQAGLWVEKEPQKAAELLQPFLGQKPGIIVHSFIDPQGRTRFVDLYPRQQEYVDFQNEMIKFGLLKSGIDIPGFVNPRFAEEAYKKFGLEKMKW